MKGQEQKASRHLADSGDFHTTLIDDHIAFKGLSEPGARLPEKAPEVSEREAVFPRTSKLTARCRYGVGRDEDGAGISRTSACHRS